MFNPFSCFSLIMGRTVENIPDSASEIDTLEFDLSFCHRWYYCCGYNASKFTGGSIVEKSKFTGDAT